MDIVRNIEADQILTITERNDKAQSD